MTTHHTVTAGPLSARLWLASDGRWKWHSYEAGKRVLRSADTLEKAKRRAAAHLRALRDGRTALLEADAATVSEFLAWRSQRVASPKIADAVASYMAHLAARGVQETRIIRVDLENFAKAIGGRMADTTVEAVQTYLDGLGVGPRRYNNVRSTLAGWFRWARAGDMIPDKTTPPERIQPRRTEDKPVAIYSPGEFRHLLAIAPAEWRLAIAVGGLAGLRSEEIYGLRWEDIRPELIEVRADTSKTRRRRLVPIQPALAAWIAAGAPCEGDMVAPRLTFSALQKRLKRHHGFKWVHNGLRHSFGTYRCAVLRNIAEVSYEMGNSVAMVKKHYLEMQTADAARQWFAIEPQSNQVGKRVGGRKARR